MSDHPAPGGLDAAGSALWASIAGPYDLRPDELSTLEDACHLADMIQFLDAEWAEKGRPTMTTGSMGQEIIHPLVDKMADHRMKRSTLLAKLKLPEAGDVAKPNQNRSAAQSRWAASHGAGG